LGDLSENRKTARSKETKMEMTTTTKSRLEYRNKFS
jgi:hypothetical protein